MLDSPPHRGVASLIRDLNRAYRETPALHARDCEGHGFEWLIVDDAANSVFAWLRMSGGNEPPVAVITNFTPVLREHYVLPLPRAGRWREIINTDAETTAEAAREILGQSTQRTSTRMESPPAPRSRCRPWRR